MVLYVSIHTALGLLASLVVQRLGAEKKFWSVFTAEKKTLNAFLFYFFLMENTSVHALSPSATLDTQSNDKSHPIDFNGTRFHLCNFEKVPALLL